MIDWLRKPLEVVEAEKLLEVVEAELVLQAGRAGGVYLREDSTRLGTSRVVNSVVFLLSCVCSTPPPRSRTAQTSYRPGGELILISRDLVLLLLSSCNPVAIECLTVVYSQCRVQQPACSSPCSSS